MEGLQMTGTPKAQSSKPNALRGACGVATVGDPKGARARSAFGFQLLAVGVTTVLVTACGGETKQLEGSLSTLVDLEYESAELIQSEEDFALRFIKRREIGEDTPVKLTYSLAGTAISTNTDMDLSEDRPAGGERSAVTREVLEDPRKTFPRIERGAIKFFSLPEPGGRVKGELHFTFEQGVEFGCGRTVFGPFEANVP